MSPIKNPAQQTTPDTLALLHEGLWSHRTVMMQFVRAVAEPSPRVNNIKKNSTAKSW